MHFSPLIRGIKQYLKTTTLHGFKYLWCDHFFDRIIWLFCCCASACCAGVLCAVLWDRFLQMPALLTLQDLHSENIKTQTMPIVAVCPTPERLADSIVEKLIIAPNTRKASSIANILALVLARKLGKEGQLRLVDQVFMANNVTLPEMLLDHMPACRDFIMKCRWQNAMMQCDDIFKVELTSWGICCVLRSSLLANKTKHPDELIVSKLKLDLALQCFNGSRHYDCKFFTKYNGEDWVEPVFLNPGFYYQARLSFSAIQEDENDKLLDGRCVSKTGYSRSRCLTKCMETLCGCTDPLRAVEESEGELPPRCAIMHINCLRTSRLGNESCHCLPSCKEVMTYTLLESTLLESVEYTYDPIYSGLNITTSVVLALRVKVFGSRLITRISTETWVTLLSSLGGVFNMFLGVGLFSALEFVFLIFVTLPIAVRKSSELIAREQ